MLADVTSMQQEGRHGFRANVVATHDRRRGEKVIWPDFRIWRAPCKGGAFQWVQAPPGNRSSRCRVTHDLAAQVSWAITGPSKKVLQARGKKQEIDIENYLRIMKEAL